MHRRLLLTKTVGNLFQNVMQSLKVDWLTHTPAGKDGTRTTARSKGNYATVCWQSACRYEDVDLQLL